MLDAILERHAVRRVHIHFDAAERNGPVKEILSDIARYRRSQSKELPRHLRVEFSHG